jgi:hypothetical protein
MRFVTVMVLDPAEAPAWAAAEFEIGWVNVEGVEVGMALAAAAAVPFDCGMAVRRFRSRKGQRHLSGLWWCATTGGHVGFESWLERDHLMLLDFDAAVVGIGSQPFWLSWVDEGGTRVRHVPDYFARCVDGSSVVVDCRPAERRTARDVAKFEATAAACTQLGWDYRLVGAVDRTVVAKVRWLAGYRHPRHDLPAVGTSLLAVFETPKPLMSGARAVGDPIAVLPTLFHLLWRGDLTVDVSNILHPETLVRAVAG